MKNREIRISRTDKGGAVVVQDTQDYVKEAKRQLENVLHYKKLQRDCTKDITVQSNKFCARMVTLMKLLVNGPSLKKKNVRCHQVYTLPKIHKSLVNTPGRPIVSGEGGPTEKNFLGWWTTG